MSNNSFIKGYAVIKAQWLRTNVLEEYFPFIADIIIREQWQTVEELPLKNKLEQKYGIAFPLMLLRQILSDAVKQNLLFFCQGKYVPNQMELSKYKINDAEFNRQWENLLTHFLEFCSAHSFAISKNEAENNILTFIDEQDDHVIISTLPSEDYTTNRFEFFWYKFVQMLASKHDDEFEFITRLCVGNLIKNTIFYAEGSNDSFRGLNIYLDTPILFALLGMDTPERRDSYLLLVQQVLAAGCNVYVFDHNFRELQSIISSAAAWANSGDYDPRKANNAARFFHDSDLSPEETVEFVSDLETKLNDIGIYQCSVECDTLGAKFQESEERLTSLLEEKYALPGGRYHPVKGYSITIDIRSIIMVYRQRAGVVATTLQGSKHIMLTINNALALISKEYELSESINAGHIPPCITADFFGAIFWLHQPITLLEYQKKRLLADCYATKRPSAKMLDAFIESLQRAREAGDISEDKFLFMRSHPLVHQKLMDVTSGDYGQFNDRTWIDVYEGIKADIESAANKRIETIQAAHAQTEKDLASIKQIAENKDAEIITLESKLKSAEQELSRIRSERDAEKLEQLQKRCRKKARWITLAAFGLPYAIITVLIQILQNNCVSVSFSGIAIGVGTVALLTLLGIFYKKAEERIYKYLIHNQKQ